MLSSGRAVESFATKRGTARFEGGAVVFEESVRGYIRSLHRDYWESDAWWREAIFLGYALWPLVAVGWAVNLLVSIAGGRANPSRIALGAGVVAVVLVAPQILNYLRGFRSPDRIALDDVESVSATRGATGLTRPRLHIAYRTDGATRTRRVNLPSLLTPDGEEAYERAVAAFEHRGFEPGEEPRSGER